ncbi:four-carbon acid sugar kinase family protein [Salmonella enterica subsp. enterica serovar Montevideo]|nr:four-carbon acid sugar kinase family protein [Salmonella enterica subsp. enterica serovar Montevideo]
MKMIVIADDFTGSNDTGVQLAKKGARTEVMLSASQKPSRRADVLVINTESRAMPADQAASAVYAALSPWCETSPAPLVYKKIDSTFRGNIGADIATAVAGALGAEGYRIQSEVAPCIPCGTFVNSEIDDLPVITKAGGFGSDSTLCDALYYIEEMYCGD